MNARTTVLRAGRAATASAVTAGLLVGGTQLVLGTLAQASDSSLLTTATVNVRSGPGTGNDILGVLGRGRLVTATGPSQAGWTPVLFNGRGAWVASQNLASGQGSDPVSSPGGASGRAHTTAALNVRSAPGLDAPVVTVLAQGTTVMLTGRVSGSWLQVRWGGRALWVNRAWVSTDASGARTPSGRTPGVVAPPVPAVVGYRYATTTLDVRTASTGSQSVGEVAAGTKLGVTGVVSNGRAQVVLSGAVRWVTAMYLSDAAPSGRSLVGDGGTGAPVGLDGLTPAAKGVVAAVRANFGQITTMYGVRPDPLPDHPSGHAVDIMLPDYPHNQALGEQIAHYMQAHASELGISYIIFHQHIWSVARSGEGWRAMADRGSDNANHVNHVHVTVA